MAKEIIGFINKNNDIFNLKDDSSASKYCCKVGQGHENKIAVFTEDGDVKDSEKNLSDFALAGHSHNAILDANTESSISIDEGIISIVIEGEGSGGETEINADNIGNLHRALTTPSSTPEDNANKLITSKAVFGALAGKANKASNATTGNLASLDENGNLQDSNTKPSDFILHPMNFVSIMYKKGTWMYSWEDNDGEEMLSVIKSIAPSSGKPGVGIVYITDYPNNKTYVFVSTIAWYKEEITDHGREIDKYNIIIEFGMTKLSGSIETDGQSYYMGNNGAFSLTGDHPIFSPANQIATKIDNTPVSTIGFQIGDPIVASNSGDDLTEICRDYQSGKICPVLATIKHSVSGSDVNTDVLGYFIPTCEIDHVPSVKLYFGGYSLLCYTRATPNTILHWERGDEHIEWDIELVKYSEIFEEQ